MSRFVRPSKYRHVFGNRSKVNYENAKISGSAWDTDLVTASGKYIAVNWQVSGGGAFAVLPSFSPFTPPPQDGFPTKLPDILPLARGHTAPVLDTAWSPFDDNFVVSGGEDGKIFLWNIEDSIFEGWGDDGWAPSDIAPVGKLNAGGRKVGQVIFHPAAESLLTSASGDHLVRVWDIKSNQDAPIIQLTGHGDSIQSIAWNAVGTTLATTCRDRKLRLFDPRAGTEAVRVTDGHGGIKGSRVVWLGDRDRIATTGFSRMSDRQLSLWDTTGLTNLETISLDSSAGIIIPFFAEGNDVLFLSGKGDGNIRYYEFEGDQFHFLNEYKTSEPQRGIGFIPRRSLEVNQNEIARAYKLANNGVEPLSFIVPRKAEAFQADIFPPANSIEPALTAAEWLSGKTARPKVVDLETQATSVNNTPIRAAASKAATPAAAPSPSPSPAPKEEPKAAPKAEPETPKEPTPAPTPPKAATPPPAAVSRASEPPKEEAKSLEIAQPDDSEDDEPKVAAAATVAAVAGAGAGAVAASSVAKCK
ncbi:Coronin-like protein crn1 [Vanrija pseudolonga]|uniref:Coronin n=1 Tax=Vanrija pseudolonga TaxID=143232 RepID=A0AAF0YAB0_9TREE|nr:Coronin-like protein crn1 [Vanrija pseudolonga]